MTMFEASQKQQDDMAQAIEKQRKLEASRKREWTVVYRDSWGEYCGISTREDGTDLTGITIEEAAAYVIANGPSHTIEWNPPK